MKRIWAMAAAVCLAILPVLGSAEMAGGLWMPVSAPSGMRLTALSLRESGGDGWSSPAPGNVFVLVRFRAENRTGSEQYLSSVVDFELYADGVRVPWSQAAAPVCNPSLDCALSVGGQAEGELGWEVPASWRVLEIRYLPGISVTLTRQDLGR